MKRWAIYLGLFFGIVMAYFAAQAPQNLESYSEFNDANVGQTIDNIAQKPHPLGTPEHDRVRDYVANAFRGLGAAVEIDSAIGVNQREASYVALAPVSNVIATIKGEDATAPAVLVMSHYDSVVNSPGAADDALGVATALEIARVLSEAPKPNRDIIFLVTDGEEAGLLGAQAFFAHSPLKDHVGVVINMEARGDAGRVNMFETGPQNAGLIALYASVVGAPSANSLSTFIYRLMPNGTDLTHAIKAHKAGLNFAMIGHENAYHTPISTPSALSDESLYHMEAQVFPIVLALSQAKTLPEAKANAIYSDLWGQYFIHYDVMTGWFIVLAIAIGLGGALTLSLKAHPVTLSSWIKAKSGGVLLLLVPALYLWTVGHAFSSFDHVQKLTHFSLLFAGTVIGGVAVFLFCAQQLMFGHSRKLMLLVTVILVLIDLCFGFETVGVILGALSLLILLFTGNQTRTGLAIEFMGKTPLDVVTVWRYSLIFNLFLSLIAQAFAPETTPVLVWPLALSTVAALLYFGVAKSRIGFGLKAIFAILAVVAMAQIGALGVTLYEALGVDLPIVIMVLLLALLPNLIPLCLTDAPEVYQQPTWELNLAVIGFAFLAYAYLVPPSAAQPQATSLIAVETANKAYLVAGVDRPDAWLKSVLGADMHHGPIEVMGTYPQYWRPLQATGNALPMIEVTRAGNEVTIHATAPKGVRRLSLLVTPDMDTTIERLNGVSVSGTLKGGEEGYYQVYLPDEAGATLVLKPSVRGTMAITAQVLSDTWPTAAPLPPLGHGYMASGIHGHTLGYATSTYKVD